MQGNPSFPPLTEQTLGFDGHKYSMSDDFSLRSLLIKGPGPLLGVHLMTIYWIGGAARRQRYACDMLVTYASQMIYLLEKPSDWNPLEFMISDLTVQPRSMIFHE